MELDSRIPNNAPRDFQLWHTRRNGSGRLQAVMD